MGHQHNHNNQSDDHMDLQQQGGRANQQGGKAGQQYNRDQQQGGQSGRQIDDNQDDMGRDVNDPNKTSNEINKKM